MNRPKLLFVIVDRQKANDVTETISALGASYPQIFYGRGTAKSEIINLLGLGDTGKAVILASVKEDAIEKIYSDLNYSYGFDKPGGGIAFTIPMTSVGGPATLKILNGDKE